MNSHIYNLQERTECNKVEPKLRLWIINYEITDIAKGAAVVKANNAKEASDVLLADSQFNAYRKIFNIIRIEEVITDGMDTNLAVEEWIKFSDIPNLDASKIIYIPSNGMNSRNVQGAIDELNTNIKDINIIEGPIGPKGEKGDKMTYDDLTENDKNDLASRVEVGVPDIDTEKLVTIDTDQEISGIKSFTNDIYIGKGSNSIIKANIDNGEFKVNHKGSNRGFIIRTNWDNDKNIMPLEMLTTNGINASYSYLFPEESGIIALLENIPTTTSQLTNDSGYISEGRVDEMIANSITNTLNTEV